MALKAPGIITFMLSIILVVCAVVAYFFQAAIPLVSGHEFATALIAYTVLLIGCLIRAI